MELSITSTKKRSISTILAYCVITSFYFLKFDAPIVEHTLVEAGFVIFASLGFYIALTNETPSILNRISAVAVAVAFSILSIPLSGSFGLSSFRLETETDVMSVSFFLIAIIGLVINGMSGKPHSDARQMASGASPFLWLLGVHAVPKAPFGPRQD